MKHKSDIRENYADLVEQSSEKRLLQVISELDAAYNQPELPANMRWSSLQARHLYNTQQKQKPSKTLVAEHLWQRRKPWSLGLGLVAVVLALSAFTFVAVSPLLGLLFNPQSAAGTLLQKQQFTQLRQTKAIQGLTINLEAAYADTNQVIIGYTQSPIHSPNQLNTGTETLRTSDGKIPPLYSGVPYYSLFNEQNFKDVAPNAIMFDANSITGNPKDVTLHFVVEVGTGGSPKLGLKPFKHLGTLAFDFTIPFHPGKVLEPHQRITVNGQTATLQKVIIAPSETRVYVSGLKPFKNYDAIESLHVAGQTARPYTGTPQADGTWCMSFTGPLFDKSGPWTIEVSQVKRGNLLTKIGDITTWTFHINVPAKA